MKTKARGRVLKRTRHEQLVFNVLRRFVPYGHKNRKRFIMVNRQFGFVLVIQIYLPVI